MHGAIDRVILSLRRIWRGADVYVVPEMVPLRARSFRTEVLQDDAGVVDLSEPLPHGDQP